MNHEKRLTTPQIQSFKEVDYGYLVAAALVEDSAKKRHPEKLILDQRPKIASDLIKYIPIGTTISVKSTDKKGKEIVQHFTLGEQIEEGRHKITSPENKQLRSKSDFDFLKMARVIYYKDDNPIPIINTQRLDELAQTPVSK